MIGDNDCILIGREVDHALSPGSWVSAPHLFLSIEKPTTSIPKNHPPEQFEYQKFTTKNRPAAKTR
jgi:hypothetical protein